MTHHPRACPKCHQPWGYDSQMNHKCWYCEYNLHNHEWKQFLRFISMFVPVLMWVGVGLAILRILGRTYNG